MQPDPLIQVPRPPTKILVRGVNWLGDAVMTSPALQRLHEHWPLAEITLLTPAKLKDLWQHHPHVHRILAIQPGDSPWKVGRMLRKEGFDLALVLPNSPRSALEVFLGKIPQRIGYARPWRNWLLTNVVHPRPHETKMKKRTAEEIHSLIACPGEPAQRAPYPLQAHHIFQYLHLVQALGGSGTSAAPQIMVTDEEVKEVKDRFLRGIAVETPCLALNPGAEYGPAKRWPADRFVQAAVQIHKQTGCALILLGGPGDVSTASQIGNAIQKADPSIPVTNLAGQTSLRQLAAVLRHCQSLLTNDSGPMHLAGALGTHVVALFGSTSWELTGPGNPESTNKKQDLLRAEVACSPCFLRECPIDFRCMTSLQIKDVVTTVVRSLA